jgi:UDP-glucose 4-epimerase
MKSSGPIVLVTGANGFVGNAVAYALENAGWIVRRAVRTASGKAGETVVGSIGRTTAWTDAVKDVDAVIHLAARVHSYDKSNAEHSYNEINTAGTLHLAQTAADLGVRDFIFVSTTLVHGRSSVGQKPLRETDPPLPDSLYGASKLAAEQGLERLNSAMRTTILRPPLVYGMDARGNFALLRKAVIAGIPLPFAGIDNRRAFVSLENLVSFILHRLSNPGGKFEIFFVADDEQVSTPEFVVRLADAAGRSPRLFSVPRSLLSFLLKVSGRREAIDSLLGSMELDLSKLSGTGWRPVATLDEGLRSHAFKYPRIRHECQTSKRPTRARETAREETGITMSPAEVLCAETTGA